LSSALVAGNKNSDNQFSGIIAGTLNTIMELETPVSSTILMDGYGNPIKDEND